MMVAVHAGGACMGSDILVVAGINKEYIGHIVQNSHLSIIYHIVQKFLIHSMS
jgi:hypothetical protein